jgi:anaerobic ribonucleoside-triphosphate reductase activating protein
MLKYCETEIVFREFPDEITLAINISNCPHRCVGCHSPHLQTDCGETLDEKAIDKLVEPVKNSITCVGLMGGDADPESVLDIAKYIKKSYPGIKVGVYSGNYELPGEETLSCIDYIKIGPYIECLGPLDSETTNQKLYKITGVEPEEIKATKSPAK